MVRTKELYEQSQPVSREEQLAFNTFTKDINTYPRWDDENDEHDYWRERQEEMETERMNAYWEDRYGN